MATDPCAAGFFSQLLHGNALLCEQRAGLTKDAQNQIQQAADNASHYYGPDSVVSAVTQNAANAQALQVKDDVNTITENIGNSDIGSPFLNSNCSGIDFTSIGLGCITKWEIGAAAGILALIIFGPYVLPYVFPRR